MDTKIYEYLIGIAEKHSISRAAEQFYLSSSALSRHLRNVEKDVGARLFQHHGTELFLTDAGKIFINNAQAILYIQRQTEKELLAMKRKEKSCLQIMIGLEEYSFFLNEIIPQYYKLNPDFPIDVSVSEKEVNENCLFDGTADLAFLITSPSYRSDKLSFVSLQKDEYMLATPPDSSTAKQIQEHGFSFKWMKEDPMILLKNKNEYHRMEQEILHLNHFIPQLTREVNRMSAALYMVKSGFGNALLPRSLLTAHGQDLPCFALVPPYYFQIIAACTKAKATQKPIQDLIQIAKDTFFQFT